MDKIDFKSKAIKIKKEAHYIMIEVNSVRRNNNFKCICTSFNRPTGRDRLQHNNNWRLCTLTFNNGQIIYPENQQRNIRVKLNLRPCDLGTNKHLQKIAPNRCQIHVFFSSSLGPFSRIDHMIGHKISLNKFKEIEIIRIIFF
jgi:hypothetical protein